MSLLTKSSVRWSAAALSLGLFAVAAAGCGGVESGYVEQPEQTEAEIQAEWEMNEAMAQEDYDG